MVPLFTGSIIIDHVLSDLSDAHLYSQAQTIVPERWQTDQPAVQSLRGPNSTTHACYGGVCVCVCMWEGHFMIKTFCN